MPLKEVSYIVDLVMHNVACMTIEVQNQSGNQ